MHAFVIRPFGTKQGVDFEKVHDELIIPSLERAGIEGYTTAAIVEAGNIRQDMFQLLLTSDLVVADVSIHNANAFYELGIRHALRDKKTFLIRCSKDDVPFDLKTDRYLSYDDQNPAATVDALFHGIRETINSDRVDSPVFLMLPNLPAQNPEHFLAIPADFSEEVEIAKSTKDRGKLSLLASETQGYAWEIPALRMIANIQYRLAFFEDSRNSWERIKERTKEDVEAHDKLATIYQRLGEREILLNPKIGEELFAKSKFAIDFLMKRIQEFPRSQRAEIFSLKARNHKANWLKTWMGTKEEASLENALTSPHLRNAYLEYYNGFNEDLNHFYSGINALGLLKIIISLAEARPMQWEMIYDSVEEAEFELKKYKDQFENLAVIIQASINAEKRSLKRQGVTNPWVEITNADLTFLVNNNPKRVESMYQMAIQLSQDLNLNAAKRQLLIYKSLNILADNVDAALGAFENTIVENNITPDHIVLFSGHMIDKPDRESPRFPPEKEEEVRAQIKKHVEQVLQENEGHICGIAGGACGGDILFHEVCHELGIQTNLYLALPRDQFIVASVQFAGPNWVERFNAIYDSDFTEVCVLAKDKTLPIWLQSKKEYSIWERNNLWLLNSALSMGDFRLTFLALWNGKEGDGPGGTKHMIEVVQQRGAKSIIIDI